MKETVRIKWERPDMFASQTGASRPHLDRDKLLAQRDLHVLELLLELLPHILDQLRCLLDLHGHLCAHLRTPRRRRLKGTQWSSCGSCAETQLVLLYPLPL